MTSDDAPKVDFESLLSRPFRWPKVGDKLFAAASAWHGNAVVTQSPRSRLAIMMRGYKVAADVLVERATASRGDRDFLVFPIIFNYRQFIELELKYILATYGPSVGVPAVWNSHGLAALWMKVQEVFEAYDGLETDNANAAVSALIAEFDQVDPGSFTYRYPVDTKGRPMDVAFEHVDLAALADVMEGLEGYFNGWDGFLDNLRSAAP